MIATMALRPGTHTIGPDDGTLRVNTYREGVAQKVGHDLVIEVGTWQATAEVDDSGTPTSVALEADSRSLTVLEGHRGVKPLSDKDRADIRSNIDEKILHGRPITFRSSGAQLVGGRLTLDGDLTIAGATRPARFTLELGEDGRVSGTLSVTQSEFGIKPYRGLMGALKVRDAVDVVLDATLPA
jgi:polyisoprenoid-binding protein YceI